MQKRRSSQARPRRDARAPRRRPLSWGLVIALVLLALGLLVFWLTPESRGLFEKPTTWLGAVLLAALAGALVAWLQPVIGKLITRAFESGPPILVQLEEPDNWYAMTLPSDVRLTEADLAALGKLSPAEQRDRLRARGGASQFYTPMTMLLTGNRDREQRLVDIVFKTECVPPYTGTIVHFAGGFGGAPDSTVLYVTLDEDPPQGVRLLEGSRVPFFPARTITLKKNEQEVVVVHAWTVRSVCMFTMDLVIMDGTKTCTQNISDNGSPFRRAPYATDDTFERIYLGGYVCRQYVQVEPGWVYPDACGLGNAGPYAPR